MYDLVIVGAGPAGLTAAIYAKRANLNVLLLDKLSAGGQVLNTFDIENYPGFTSINGADLAIKMFEQVMHLGVEFDYKTVTDIKDLGKTKEISTLESEDKIITKSVIIASGTTPRKLGIKGEEELSGKSISWCAICDGHKYDDKDVVVIGGGNSAVDESIYMSEFVKSITVITDFDLTSDPSSAEHLRSLDNVTVHPYKKVLEFIPNEDGLLKAVKFANKDDESLVETVEADGVFEYIGAIPQTDYAQNLGIDIQRGYVKVNEFMETGLDGVFAVGDCTIKHLRQVATAVNDGAIAGQRAFDYVKKLETEM
ncbi:putative thioredoxin-disulfide reductase [Anaerococcus hydrogenalis DSM 7454]|uniref:Putative thioredoxin-disulfide reductase n=1 Tax=Anaerococcus hydrogenalis DSM 7454 TaxID=561177 RepID=B6WB30_9FIRM|nr:FAD-dependent oxidoreductase [Anaerococcus hydrogenalis]EEB35299.1 putative thioredoxin-disulfide reductase [Anaerococcus hydrogenalis DSM 7454]